MRGGDRCRPPARAPSRSSWPPTGSSCPARSRLACCAWSPPSTSRRRRRPRSSCRSSTHPNRRVSIAALAALARQGAVVEGTVLDGLLADDAALCAHALAAAASMTPDDGAVRRALDDLLALVADRVLAVLAVRHGEERIAAARRALASADGAAPRPRRGDAARVDHTGRGRARRTRRARRPRRDRPPPAVASPHGRAGARSRRVGSPTSRSTRPGGGARRGCKPSRSTPSSCPHLPSLPCTPRTSAARNRHAPDGAQPALDELVLVASGSAGPGPADPSWNVADCRSVRTPPALDTRSGTWAHGVC